MTKTLAWWAAAGAVLAVACASNTDPSGGSASPKEAALHYCRLGFELAGFADAGDGVLETGNGVSASSSRPVPMQVRDFTATQVTVRDVSPASQLNGTEELVDVAVSYVRREFGRPRQGEWSGWRDEPRIVHLEKRDGLWGVDLGDGWLTLDEAAKPNWRVYVGFDSTARYTYVKCYGDVWMPQ